MSSKNDIISKVYYDEAGYGSIESTLADAKKYDPTITYEDVKKWKDGHAERKTYLKGYNSFVISAYNTSGVAAIVASLKENVIVLLKIALILPP
jgi:hypothetical protein